LTARLFAGIVDRVLRNAIIRAFDGSLADAEGLLAVEKATFDESPYSAERVQAILTGGGQRAWLALGQGQVVGFVAAFATYGLRGPCWEIDLLAVHPDWTGLGLATRLIRAAAAHGRAAAGQVRAVVAADNLGSARAFTRAGFRRGGTCELLIFHPEDDSPRFWVASGVTIRQVDTPEQLAALLPETTGLALPAGAPSNSSQGEQGRMSLLLAEQDGQPAGYAEVIEVQTLLYRGVWIESLAATRQQVRRALVKEVVERAIAAGLDEIGMMVPEGDPLLGEILLAAGFRSLGRFDWLTARLPLPGLASSPSGADSAGGQSGVADV
jgi:ribosomal protein S18 acetylase RimI-like enzyme